MGNKQGKLRVTNRKDREIRDTPILIDSEEEKVNNSVSVEIIPFKLFPNESILNESFNIVLTDKENTKQLCCQINIL